MWGSGWGMGMEAQDSWVLFPSHPLIVCDYMHFPVCVSLMPSVRWGNATWASWQGAGSSVQKPHPPDCPL